MKMRPPLMLIYVIHSLLTHSLTIHRVISVHTIHLFIFYSLINSNKFSHLFIPPTPEKNAYEYFAARDVFQYLQNQRLHWPLYQINCIHILLLHLDNFRLHYCHHLLVNLGVHRFFIYMFIFHTVSFIIPYIFVA